MATKRNQPLYRTYAKTPQEKFGNCMGMEERAAARRYVQNNFYSHLTMSEYVVLTAIMNRTEFFGKYFESIPQKHIHGQRAKNEDISLPIYPISKRSVGGAIASLLKKGFIIELRNETKDWWWPFYGINFLLFGKDPLLAQGCFNCFMEAYKDGIRPTERTKLGNFSEQYADELANNWMAWSLKNKDTKALVHEAGRLSGHVSEIRLEVCKPGSSYLNLDELVQRADPFDY